MDVCLSNRGEFRRVWFKWRGCVSSQGIRAPIEQTRSVCKREIGLMRNQVAESKKEINRRL